ncbi:MAG TPA: matrixin family metalloprotease [Chitinophagaceae bacterium]|jgi:archaemetzincin|nr:matrixin family metalloprotease [Chitinophagaceae bacterium]
MKIILSFLSLALLATCRQSPSLSLKNNKQKQIIALQPFNDYDESRLNYLALDIRDFYNKQTIILKPVKIPEHFYDTVIRQYSADSLIMFLSKLRNDSIVEVVGLTHNPIFTIKEKKGFVSSYDENLFGYAHQPGNVCIVSDFKFNSDYQTLYFNRLRKVITHEMGHNLGLSHCLNDKCLMSEKNGNTINLDNGGNDYCQKCKNILYH